MRSSSYLKTISLILILLLSSCWSDPRYLPGPRSSPSLYALNQKIMELSMGSSTREEVISIIGEPDIKLKRFILYKQKVQGVYWGIDPDISSPQGDWMDVIFEFDQHGILAEYRDIKLEHLISGLDLTQCSSICRSNYYSCLISTEEKNTSLSQCEGTLHACFRQCEDDALKIYEEACDPGMESCT